MTAAQIDCLIVGGGPAGLTAAIYLARFHLGIVVLDAGKSRAALIPKTRNHAGFPEGISGTDLLRRMNQQARIYGVRIEHAEVQTIRFRDGLFRAMSDRGRLTARAVLLATGVVNRRPEMPEELHDEAVRRGLLRYCPICDGYEVTDKSVAVIGSGERGVKEALFLRSYTTDVTLLSPAQDPELDEPQRRSLDEAGIAVVAGPLADFVLGSGQIGVMTSSGPMHFTSIYPALGSTIGSQLAVPLGAAVSPEGCLLVDAHQRTTVPGLYAAGDVVQGLDQISHAMGEGGIAATTMRNDLSAMRPLYR